MTMETTSAPVRLPATTENLGPLLIERATSIAGTAARVQSLQRRESRPFTLKSPASRWLIVLAKITPPTRGPYIVAAQALMPNGAKK